MTLHSTYLALSQSLQYLIHREAETHTHTEAQQTIAYMARTFVVAAFHPEVSKFTSHVVGLSETTW